MEIIIAIAVVGGIIAFGLSRRRSKKGGGGGGSISNEPTDVLK